MKRFLSAFVGVAALLVVNIGIAVPADAKVGNAWCKGLQKSNGDYIKLVASGFNLQRENAWERDLAALDRSALAQRNKATNKSKRADWYAASQAARELYYTYQEGSLDEISTIYNVRYILLC